MIIDGRPIGAEHPVRSSPRSPPTISPMWNAPAGSSKLRPATGESAVKIRTYDAELAHHRRRPAGVPSIRTPPWEGLNYYQLYRKIALPFSATANGCSSGGARQRRDDLRLAVRRACRGAAAEPELPGVQDRVVRDLRRPTAESGRGDGKPVLGFHGRCETLSDIEETLRVLRARRVAAISGCSIAFRNIRRARWT